MYRYRASAQWGRYFPGCIPNASTFPLEVHYIRSDVLTSPLYVVHYNSEKGTVGNLAMCARAFILLAKGYSSQPKKNPDACVLVRRIKHKINTYHSKKEIGFNNTNNNKKKVDLPYVFAAVSIISLGQFSHRLLFSPLGFLIVASALSRHVTKRCAILLATQRER